VEKEMIKLKTGNHSQHAGKTGKVMKDFDVKFSDALWIHIQSKLLETPHVKKSKAE
jgi:hypothetical protein